MNGEIKLGTKLEIEGDISEPSVSQEASQTIEIKGEQQINSLAAYINNAWERNSKARIATTGQFESVEQRMIRNRQDLEGQYDSYKWAQIKAGGGTKHFARLTFPFSEQALAWMAPTFFPTDGSDIFSLKPSPLPELPAELIDEILTNTVRSALSLGIYQRDIAMQPIPHEDILAFARENYNQSYKKILDQQIDSDLRAAENMTKLIKDQLNKAKFNDALKDNLSDTSWAPSIFLKYPVIRMKKVEKKIRSDITTRVEIEEIPVKTAERVDPFNAYPAPGVKCPEDGDFIERLPLTPADLSSLRNAVGYKTDAIQRVLDKHPRGYRRATTADDAKANVDKVALPESSGEYPNIDTLEFWGKVPGKLLKEWEVDLDMDIDEYQYYNICAWLAGQDEVIKAMINPNPFGKYPYYITGYKRVPGSAWNQALGDILRDPQSAYADTCRALINNLQKSSEPVTVIDVALLHSKTAGTVLSDLQSNGVLPGMRILIDSARPTLASNVRPIDFFQPKNNVAENIAALNYFQQQASLVSGIPIPRDTLGSLQPPGTSSGQQMDRADGLKRLGWPISNINDDIIKPLIYDMFLDNMLDQNVPDAMKGDLEVVIAGTASSIAIEERARKVLEGINLMQNPAILQMMGPGAAEILKQYYKMLGFDPDKIVQSSEQPQQPPMLPEQAPPEQATPQGAVPLAQSTPLQPDGATEQGGAQPLEKVV